MLLWHKVSLHMFYCVLGASLPVTGNKLLRGHTLGTTPLRAPGVRLVAIGMKKATVIKRK